MGEGFGSRGSGGTPAAERLAGWGRLNGAIASCELCPRLRDYCLRVADEKRKAFREWVYWGRPVPNFGDPEARLLLVGLAPAAHGGNRTGRMFTGDRSGDFLYAALHRAGFSSGAAAVSRDDGLALTDCAVTAIVHCAPPGNKPESEEIKNCSGWLEETFALVPFRVLLVLGQTAWGTVLGLAARKGWLEGRPPRFAHGASSMMSAGRLLIASYHPSQRNTFTGRLTRAMLGEVLERVREFMKK